MNPTKSEIEAFWKHHDYTQWDEYLGLDKDELQFLSHCKLSLDEIINGCLFRFAKYSKEKLNYRYWDRNSGELIKISEASFVKIGYLLARETREQHKYYFYNNYDDNYDILLENIVAELLYDETVWNHDSLLEYAKFQDQNTVIQDDEDLIEFICSRFINTKIMYHIGSLPFERLLCL